MALLGTINKQPRERLDFDINYATVLVGRADTIGSQTVEVSPAGLTVSITRTNNIVKVIFSSGSDGTLYKVTVLATSTPSGLIYEDEVNVLVGED